MRETKNVTQEKNQTSHIGFFILTMYAKNEINACYFKILSCAC